MRTLIRSVATLQLVFILPSALFLTAVLVGTGAAPQYGMAHVARGIVGWYAGRVWTLWLLLIALPVAVLFAGCATLLRSWNGDADVDGSPAAPPSLATIPAPLATLAIGGTTLTSAAILAIVALHMLAN